MKFPTCFKRKREKYGKNITPTRRAGAVDIVGPGPLGCMTMIFGESLSKRNQLRPSTTTARGRKTALFVPIELDEGRSTQIELNEGRSRSIEVNECRSRSIELDRVSSSSIKVNRVSSSSIEVNRVSSSSIQMSPNELDRANKKETARPPVPRGSRGQLLISFNTTEANQHGTPTDVAFRRA